MVCAPYVFMCIYSAAIAKSRSLNRQRFSPSLLKHFVWSISSTFERHTIHYMHFSQISRCAHIADSHQWDYHGYNKLVLSSKRCCLTMATFVVSHFPSKRITLIRCKFSIHGNVIVSLALNVYPIHSVIIIACMSIYR